MSLFKECIQSRAAWKYLLVSIALISVFVGGLAMRRAVFQAQEELISGDVPFSLESALHYRRTKIYFDRGGLPDVDRAIQHPEGVRIAEIDSIASEPFYAVIAGWFPADMSFSSRLRWIEAGWFCLSMPLLMILIRVWSGSWTGGFVAAVLYAVGMASVIRTTGQEISRENFAIPWFIASQVCAALYFRTGSGPGRLVSGLASAVLLGMALIAWDMMQYVVGIWTIGFCLHLLIRGPRLDTRALGYHLFLLLAVFLVGLVHPYHRFHGLSFSPLSVLMVSAAACGFYLRSAAGEPGGISPRRRWSVPLAILVIPAIVMAGVLPFLPYGSAYGHFGELLAAKIRFLNEKPADPGLLTFAQRIMWVPSLHSASWGLTKWLFPLTFWISCFIAIVWLIKTIKRPIPLVSFWLLLFLVSIAAYIFFVRFHVFVALSSVVLCGWAYGRTAAKSPGFGAAFLALLVVSGVAEGAHTYSQREGMGRPNVYYEELKELAAWLEDHVAPNAVLGNMGVSAYAAAYGKCAIVIHPKFEDRSIRKRLEHYGELMFGADEKSLRDWMDTLDVRYLIYSYGEFSGVMPEYQMRYFVDMMDPPETAPARRFERKDNTLRYFRPRWGNRKYAVYEVFSREDEAAAAEVAATARQELEQGDLIAAEAYAVKSLSLDPGQEEALRIMRHVGSLYEQGFSYPGTPGGERDE